MEAQRKTPASLGDQTKGDAGVPCSGVSLSPRHRGVEGGTPSGGALDLGRSTERPQLAALAAACATAHPASGGPLSQQQAEALPCLSSNNSTEAGQETQLLGSFCLSAQQKKSAAALAWNVQSMAEKHGIERLGFLTLTFSDHVLCPKESQRRWNSLRTHVLSHRYADHIRVFERQKSGRIHYHLLVVMPSDIRTGVDFSAFMDDDYRTAPKALRDEWVFWRKTAKAYGFGRTELLPVRSTEEGIGRYLGKYIGKHHQHRKSEDKGVRLVEYSRGARVANTRFAWCSDGAAEWRAKVRVFTHYVRQFFGLPDSAIQSIEDLSSWLGPRWAYLHRDFIASLPVCLPPPGMGTDPQGRVYSLSTGEVIT